MIFNERKSRAECTNPSDTFHSMVTVVSSSKIVTTLTKGELLVGGKKSHYQQSLNFIQPFRRGRREERERMLWSKSDDNLDTGYSTFNDRSASQYWR